MSLYLSAFEQGQTVEQVQGAILGSDEFFAVAGRTNQGFLNLLYKTVLNRDIDLVGLLGFGGELATNVPRSTVALQMLTSPEYQINLVQSYYQQLLHRQADSGGLNSFVTGLGGGMRDEDVIGIILSSGEYFARS